MQAKYLKPFQQANLVSDGQNARARWPRKPYGDVTRTVLPRSPT